jgi:hypothetical protein
VAGATGIGAECIGAECIGAEGIGAEGIGAEGIGAEGIGAEGIGAPFDGPDSSSTAQALVSARRLIRPPSARASLRATRGGDLWRPVVAVDKGSRRRG